MEDLKNKIKESLRDAGIAVLPPMDAFQSMDLLSSAGIHVECTMLDPWYNRGTGGTVPESEYDRFIRRLLESSGRISDTMYLWGFPDVVGPYVRYAPDGFRMGTWITWYYKNCPSVIRGWRSSQQACLQYVRDGYRLHPENFMDAEKKKKLEQGGMRFVPGPTSVIESPLIIGFVGKKEQTGHPSQKPESVFDSLLKMALPLDGIVFDPMAGSGTTGASAVKNGYGAVLCDHNDEYIKIIEKRLKVQRIKI